MERQLLIDNDALLKLARYGLIDAALCRLGATVEDLRVSATASFSLLPAKNRLLRCKDGASASRVEAVLAGSKHVDAESIDPNLLDVLNAAPLIDSGEALLFAAGVADENTYVITGDKRVLVALSNTPAIAHVAEALSHRVISIEILLAELIERDFAETQLAVRRNPDVDKALCIAFGMSAPAPLESVREALNSYAAHLRKATGELLVPPAFSSSRKPQTDPSPGRQDRSIL